MKFYLDTCIWLDIIEKRGHHGEKGRLLLDRFVRKNNTIIYSDVIITELSTLGYVKNEIRQLINTTYRNIKWVQATKQQLKEAKKISKIRSIVFGDVLHAIIARDHEAEVISRDAHFLRLKDIVRTKSPGEVLDTYA